jgi:hypothetical protein
MSFFIFEKKNKVSLVFLRHIKHVCARDFPAVMQCSDL